MSRGVIGEMLGVHSQVLAEEISPMTPLQTAVSELLDALHAGDGVDLVCESVRLALQQDVISAVRYECTASRTTNRNGSRPRLSTTKGGHVTIALPKLRQGSFFPSILEPRCRIDLALYAM